MSETEELGTTFMNKYMNFNNDNLDSNKIGSIILWTVIIVVFMSIGLAIMKGGKLASETLKDQIELFFRILLTPITFIFNKIKRFIFFFLPADSKQFFKSDGEAGYIGQAWNTHNRLSTIVITATLAMMCFSGYMTFNPDKFPSIYGKILTYVAVVITLFFLFKSVLLYTTWETKSADQFEESFKSRQSFNWPKDAHKKKFEEQRSWLLNNTLNYLKISAIAIVALAILGFSLFFITTTEDGAKYANTIITFLGIVVLGLIGYSYLKKVPFIKYLLNNKLFSLIYHTLFLIPCFILEFTESIYKEIRHAPRVAWWILLIELIIIMVYIIGPLITKSTYLNVHSKDMKNGGVRFKQEIAILQETNKKIRKQIIEIKNSDDPNNQPLKPGNLPIGDSWTQIMNDMLWVGDDYYNGEIEKLNQEKNRLQQEQRAENQAQRDADVPVKPNRNITNKIENIDDQIDQLTLMKSTQPKREELEKKIINILWEDALSKGYLETKTCNGSCSQKDKELYTGTHRDVYNAIYTTGPFKLDSEAKAEYYNKFTSSGTLKAFLGQADMKGKYSKVEELVLYVQEKGKEIDEFQRKIQENNEKIKLLESRIGKEDGHPKTVVLLHGPKTLQRKYNPPGGKYPRARFPRKITNSKGEINELPVSEYDGGFNYDFAISSWIFIHAQPPNFYLGKKKTKNILQWSNNSFAISYNTNNNSLEITTKDNNKPIVIKNILLQKWINLVINYDGGHLDIFMDGELVKTLPQIVNIMPNMLSMKIGEKNGVRGGICNVVHFASHLTKSQIVANYEAFKDKDPPIL